MWQLVKKKKKSMQEAVALFVIFQAGWWMITNDRID